MNDYILDSLSLGEKMEIFENNGGENCSICEYNYICNGQSVSSTPSGPYYAPCASGYYENWLDEDALDDWIKDYIEDVKENKNE